MNQLLTLLRKDYKFKLVSHSPRRRKILKEVGLKFEVLNNSHRLPEVIRNYFYRFDIVRETFQKFNGLKIKEGEALIACDTIVVYNFHVFGKPKNKAQAVSFLRKLSGKKHYVLSCVAIQARHNNNMQKISAVEKTAVYFRKLSEVEIAAYADSVEPYDKAGGYGIQGKAKIFVKKICGCYDNVVGLPVYKFLLLLARLRRR